MSSQEFKTDATARILAEAAKMPVPTPLQLEEGKFYRTRDGRKAQASFRDVVDAPHGGYWWLRFEDQTGISVNRDGRWAGGIENASDAIAEWGEYGLDYRRLRAGADIIAAEMLAEPVNVSYAVPSRVRILNDAARLTSGERDKEYGPPAVNMAAAGELKAVFRKHLARDMSAGELEAIDLALTKLGRIATGKPKRDTYVDAAAYMAIAGEIALGYKDE